MRYCGERFMYARQLERRGGPLAAFGRIAEGRKVGRELGMNRPNQGRAAGAPTDHHQSGFEAGHF